MAGVSQLPSQLKFDAKDWQAYGEADRIFSKAIVERYKPDDLVWVHDYQLMLLPQMLRDELPDAAIGFFLHIPFPSSEIFPILPRREELLQGLLGADLVAFQTHGHLQQFRSALLRVLGAAQSGIAVSAHGDRKSTRLNSSHRTISYAVFCLKKKKKKLEPHLV